VKSSVPAQLASNWIEIFAVPIAAALMETQPIMLLLQFIGVRLLGEGTLLLDPVSVTLLLIFLHWWALGIRYFMEQRGLREGQTVLFSLLGVVLALALLGGTHFFWLDNSSFVIVSIGLTAWAWYRGRLQARLGLSDEYLINAFKIGFFVLLGIMVFAVLGSIGGVDPDLLTALGRDLPIFFLSGMIALSFTRIGTLKKEQKHHPGSAPKEATGRWLAGLTITWVVLVVVSVAFEALPLQAIMTALSPFWDLVGLLASALLYVIGLIVYLFMYLFGLAAAAFIFLFGGLLHQQGSRKPVQPQQIKPVVQAVQHGGNTTLTRILIVLFLLILILIVMRVVQKARKDKAGDNADEEEEVREALDMAAVLKARRDERKLHHKETLALEALDPASIRARYRDFLQSMATKGDDLERRASETPGEYQTRLLTLAQQRRLLPEGVDDADPAILEELTRAYDQERYGGKKIDNSKQDYLRARVPGLTQHLTSGVPVVVKKAKPTASTSRGLYGWGDE